jgi:hypothetical protein
MTPQERALIDDLFGRLAKLENTPRDPDALRAINDGLTHAPNAIYPLVQTVLVQDEALKRANARIEELESGGAQTQSQGGGFLDSMRNALGGGAAAHGSVPSVRPGMASNQPDPRWNTGGTQAQAAPYGAPMGGPFNQGGGGMFGGGGGSFLGTAAAAAAGMIGGSLLLNGIQSMFGHHGQAFAAYQPDAGSPWGGNSAGSAAGSDLARDAGLGDIGGSGFGGGNDQRAGLLDTSDNDNSFDDSGDVADDADFGGFDGGSDTA